MIKIEDTKTPQIIVLLSGGQQFTYELLLVFDPCFSPLKEIASKRYKANKT